MNSFTQQPVQPSLLPFLGRLLMAVIFVYSGLGKVANPQGTMAFIASSGMPLTPVAYVGAVLLELGGSLLLVLGYRTKLLSLAFAIYCVVSGLFFHLNFADQNQLLHFMKNLAMAGGFLQLTAFGAGALSIDFKNARRLEAANRI